MSKTAGAIVLLSLCTALSPSTLGKQYNRGTHIAPEQRAKIDKTIAKANVQTKTSSNDSATGDIVSEGITKTDCGKIAIGNVEAPKYGNKAVKVDRDIIITGDVINVATDCKNVGS